MGIDVIIVLNLPVKDDDPAAPTAHPQAALVVSVEGRGLQQQGTAGAQEAGEGHTVVLDLRHVQRVVGFVSDQ